MEEQVIYKPGETHVKTLIVNGKSRYSHKTTEEYLQEFPDHKLMTLDEALPHIEKAENENYVHDFKEITKEEFWDALECLPPKRWNQGKNKECFLMREYWTSNITMHYFRIETRYFCGQRRDTESIEFQEKMIRDKFFKKD